MAFDVSRFGISDTMRCDIALRRAAEGGDSVEATAQAVCEFLYESMQGPSGDRACPLVRFYLTHPYNQLPASDRAFARRLLASATEPSPSLKCLALLGTRGDIGDWNDRRASRGHRAIPLPTLEMVEQAPMIARLFRDLGVELSAIVNPLSGPTAELQKRTYNVFHVEHALGDPDIPAQDGFVKRYRVESVVGFGGSLPWGEHFAVILFSREHISTSVARRFKSLALGVKSRLLRFDMSKVFGVDAPDVSREREEAAPVTPTPTASAARVMMTAETQGSTGASRRFIDSNGIEWQLWQIKPSIAEQQFMDDAKASLSTTSASASLSRRGAKAFERQKRWDEGWLLFEASHESRRLSPIPANWLSATDLELERICAEGVPTPRISH